MNSSGSERASLPTRSKSLELQGGGSELSHREHGGVPVQEQVERGDEGEPDGPDEPSDEGDEGDRRSEQDEKDHLAHATTNHVEFDEASNQITFEVSADTTESRQVKSAIEFAHMTLAAALRMEDFPVNKDASEEKLSFWKRHRRSRKEKRARAYLQLVGELVSLGQTAFDPLHPSLENAAAGLRDFKARVVALHWARIFRDQARGYLLSAASLCATVLAIGYVLRAVLDVNLWHLDYAVAGCFVAAPLSFLTRFSSARNFDSIPVLAEQALLARVSLLFIAIATFVVAWLGKLKVISLYAGETSLTDQSGVGIAFALGLLSGATGGALALAVVGQAVQSAGRTSEKKQ